MLIAIGVLVSFVGRTGRLPGAIIGRPRLRVLITVRYMSRGEQHLRQTQALEESGDERAPPPPERLAPA